MIFHAADPTQKRLASCFKRAVSLGKAGEIDHHHLLAPVWSNVCYFLDGGDEVDAYDLVLLDYAAMRIEEYSRDHLIANDESVRAILHQWLSRLPVIPAPAMAWARSVRVLDRAPIGYQWRYVFRYSQIYGDAFVTDDFGNLVLREAE